jgi:CubicO group peptidase (beta-lactamase class C family)
VTESTRVDTGTDLSPDFQYYWWMRSGSGTPNDFWAQGNHGQFIYVAPERDVVLVRFGIECDYGHWPELLAGLTPVCEHRSAAADRRDGSRNHDH